MEPTKNFWRIETYLKTHLNYKDQPINLTFLFDV